MVGKSSAMAWGGRYLYRLLVRERGMDPSRILITDLDADFRVHPKYFSYLAWTHLGDPNRETQLYQPIPYFHNNMWEAPILLRLFAGVLTQLQLWRNVMPEKLVSFSSYSTTLRVVHEVGYWATDAIPEDSRFYWKSYFTYGDRFRAVPLFIPIYGDAVRAQDLLALDGGPVHPGEALGVGRHRHPVRRAERLPRTPRSRSSRGSGGS